MTTNDDWSAAAAEWQRERRATLAERTPEVETLRAFFAGDLAEAEMVEVREYLAAYPEVAAAFQADENEPLLVGPGHPAFLSRPERQAGWEALADRVGIGPRVVGLVLRYRLLALAASLVAVGFGLAYVDARAQLKPRVVTPQTLQLDLPRGQPPVPWPVHLEPGAPQVWLHLPLPRQEQNVRYQIVLQAERPAGLKSLWQQRGLVATADDTLDVALPSRWVQPGVYQLRVSRDPASAADPPVAIFRFETE